MPETSNIMLKRGMSDHLRDRTIGQQARHFYGKCLTHNLPHEVPTMNLQKALNDTMHK